MLCRCASPGGEPSVCIARACSHASRVPVSAGGPVPSPGQAAAAAPQQCCQAPTCHTNDACGRREQAPQQTGSRSSCSAAQASARRMSAAQQCSSTQARGGLTLPLLVVCAMPAERIGVLLFNRSPFNESWAKGPRMRMPEGRVGIPKPLKQTINRQGPAGSRPHRRPRPKHRRREVARLGVRVSSA